MSSDPKLPNGTNMCKCAACGEYFQTVLAFDRHRIGSYGEEHAGKFGVGGDRRCVDVASMAEAKLSLNPKGYWRLPERAFKADRATFKASK